MLIKTENEVYVQVLYGNNWEDFEEAFDLKDAQKIKSFLEDGKKEKRVRIIKRTVQEEII